MSGPELLQSRFPIWRWKSWKENVLGEDEKEQQQPRGKGQLGQEGEEGEQEERQEAAGHKTIGFVIQ